MKRKTKKRLIKWGIFLGAVLLVVAGYEYVMHNMLIPADQVIKCSQKSVWNNEINAAELDFAIENEYSTVVHMPNGDVKGYRLPIGRYGLVSFGTANVYVYEALTFNGKTDYYQTWTIMFHTGSQVIQRKVYSSPTEYTTENVEDEIRIEQEDNLVMVNGTVEFYILDLIDAAKAS